MKDDRCVICKYSGDHQKKQITRDQIWREKGRTFRIPLCYLHSWELFRLGQKVFFATYSANFKNYYGTETEKELFDHLKGEKTNPWET